MLFSEIEKVIDLPSEGAFGKIKIKRVPSGGFLFSEEYSNEVGMVC